MGERAGDGEEGIGITPPVWQNERTGIPHSFRLCFRRAAIHFPIGAESLHSVEGKNSAPVGRGTACGDGGINSDTDLNQHCHRKQNTLYCRIVILIYVVCRAT